MNSGNPLTKRLQVLLAAVTAVWLAATGAAAEPSRAASPHTKIHVIDFEGEIEPALSAYVRRRLKAAVADQADAIVIRIDSWGGRGDSSMEISDAILDLPKAIRTYAWIPDKAISGGCMVALACDEVVMGPRGRLGDCQPILQTSEGIVPVGEKAETVIRAQFRRFAEDNGWPVLLSEKIVSKDFEIIEIRHGETRFFVRGAEFDSARPEDLIQGFPKKDLIKVGTVSDKGQLLTMTTSEAMHLGFVSRTFETEPPFLAAISAPGAQVSQVKMTWTEGASRWLLGATGILGALVLLCAGLTVFQGLGISTIIGAVALVLTGLVIGTADLAYGFPLFLICVGLLLLAAEAFLIPGFGVPGILGILSLGAGFLFLGTAGSPAAPTSAPSVSWDAVRDFIVQFGITLIVGGAVFVALSRIFPSLPFASRHLLLAPSPGSAGPAVLATDVLPRVGAEGTADTPLRPAGRAVVGGRLVDVTSEGDFVEAGAPLRVVRVEGGRVVVRPETKGARP